MTNVCADLGLSHAGQMMHSGGPPPPPHPSSMSSLEAMHNFSRERELMALMLSGGAAGGARFDPMALAFANSLQVRSSFALVKNQRSSPSDATSRRSFSDECSRTLDAGTQRK